MEPQLADGLFQSKAVSHTKSVKTHVVSGAANRFPLAFYCRLGQIHYQEWRLDGSRFLKAVNKS